MNETFPRTLVATPHAPIDPYPGAQSVTRALTLLKSFSDQQPEWTLAELARSVNLNKTTVYRLLAALEAEGLLARSATTGAYRLGPELIVLGSCAMRSNDLRTVSRDLLERLAEESGETSTLEMLSGRDVIVLDEVSSRFLLGLSQEVGARLPAHATSTGKLLLAYAYDQALAALEEYPLPRLASQTRTTTIELRADFPRIRLQGYATSDNELEPGFAAIAAPLYNHQGQVQAAISIGGPTARLQGEAWDRGIEMTCRTAREISRRLGWQGRQNCP
jgi:DNA-binding IclR family transcriptional regulator